MTHEDEREDATAQIARNLYDAGIRTPAGVRAFLSGDYANALVATVPGGIEAQEATGQQRLIAEALLPREGTIEPLHGRQDIAPNRAQLEAWGFRFGDVHDEALVHVTLPDGWYVEPTEHSMWSTLYDHQRRQRGRIFFKAAFYDYCAHFNVTPRYEYREYYASSPNEPEDRDTFDVRDAASRCCVVVRDRLTGDIIWHSLSLPASDYEMRRAAFDSAEAYLEQHYPSWRDPFAYWDDVPDTTAPSQ